MRTLLGAGTACAAALVVGATRAGGPQGAVLPDGPLGLWRAAADGHIWYAVLVAVAMFGLVAAFAQLCRRAENGSVTTRDVARAAALWCAPVLLAPPLLSLDAYSYIAQGTMLISGLDPYTLGPQVLGDGPTLDAVSPVWRATPAPYGPLSLALLGAMASVSGAHPSVAVCLLRVTAAAACALATLCAAWLARPQDRALTVALIAANPLVIVHIVGGAHLDALLMLLAVVTVAALTRGRWLVAAIASGAAFALKLPGLVLIGIVLLRGRHRLWRVGAVVFAIVLACAALVPNGWGWLMALSVPGRIRHPYDPATILGSLLYALGRASGHLAYTGAVTAARIATMVAGAATVAVLLWRAAASKTEVRVAALTGAALVAVAVAAPAVHAWYLAWGLALVAVGPPRARWWLAGLSAALCFTALPEALLRSPAGLGLTVALAVGAVAVVYRAATADAPLVGPVVVS